LADRAYQNALKRRAEIRQQIAELQQALSERPHEADDVQQFIERWHKFAEFDAADAAYS
jgi:chorismate mutase